MSETENIEVEVRQPTQQDLIDARLFSGGIFKKALEQDNPPPPRDKLSEYLKKLGMWDDSKDKRFKELTNKIAEGERQLARGAIDKDGNKVTKEFVKNLAIDMRKWRNEQLSLIAQLRTHDYLTIEGIVEDANFNFLVSRCSYKNGERLYKDYYDYIERQNSEEAFECASRLSKLLYGDNFEKDNPEIKFLQKYNFMDEEMHYVDKDGNLVDENGRRIDKKGRYINEQGQLIDINGNLVDEDGNPIETFVEFDE